ncbi:signal transduction histidine kinase/ActR/RegA family two-component response regulator [Aquimarina sp. EL_43]|uniref:tetratricopeptide repeat-containing hybrid sensor histidine kinase/response regulator n=1 Tax=unclassified Aquimarina TaxID=2627091 RepID=UPI0018C96E3B|nr:MULTISPECIES: response regulator [unclassified Aquimarina]MBG6130582.1 signal transduction histidine kinase/ActR/RegA family two-component response regulator [Aquimarina sp. EL_35]MBG6151272.1 signal transduction histidine kinase/ActR/RegA family two-component response regulator [Aquimarina sp. EL_32]MBG6168984.1 signal transduction histidine kinase/ActR/RegA family two-component response regulator [Aquimarina sp. EL_43]
MKYFIQHITIIFLVSFTLSVQSQSSITSDSIQSYIEKAEKLQEEYKYEQSLEIAQAALHYAQYNNDDKSLGYINNIIAKNYETSEDDNEARRYYRRALTYARSSKSEVLETDLYNNLARVYTKHNLTRKQGVGYYKKSYEFAVRLKDTIRMIRPLLNLGEYYISRNDFDSSYEYLAPARKLIHQKSSNLDKTKLNSLLGKYFLSVRKFIKSEEYTDKAISYAIGETKNKENNDELISRYYEELASAYETKSGLYVKQDDYRKAYSYQKKQFQNILQANNHKKLKELRRANIKYEVDIFEKRAKKAESEKKESESEVVKWRISIILGIILILISLAFLISSYKNNIQKKRLNNDLLDKNKELISAKETAEQVSTLKSQFISTVSHELRTPLYGVIGLTSLLMENPDKKKTNEYLESLKFSGDYLLALINDVLQLSKIETNEVKLEKVSFDIRTLIEGIVNSLHTKQKSNNNTVHIEIDKKINTTLLGDSVRLSQILINLIGNALKFTKDGNIWVNVKCIDNKEDNYILRFIVRDDGIGIPKNKQQTIFDNFAQVKNENQEYEGTGLGLAIVKKLIHLHNSEIHIKSKENQGSEFYFDLYYEKAVKEQEISLKTGENLSIGTSNFYVLIVDDNKINQIVTQNILKKKGYTCNIANNGMDAIEMLKNEKFDLVLMDINMPEMNGLEATKVVRTFNTNIPIIALTAVEEGEIRNQALSVGMNDVIIKPYDTQQFFQTIMRNISKVKMI